MTRADRQGGHVKRREAEPMRPSPTRKATALDAEPEAGCEAQTEAEDVALGGRVWALRCAGVLCEAPSPDKPDHPAPHVGYMRASLDGGEDGWPF